MRLLLLRHGQTTSNVQGLLDTAVPGALLTPLGLSQAGQVPDALLGEEIGAIYASTLTRTQQTASPLALQRQLPASVINGVQEIEAGDLEMRGDTDAYAVYVNTFVAWAAGSLDERIPGGPNGHEFFARYDAAIAEVVATGVECAVVVSHGAAIRCWAPGRASDLPADFAGNHSLDNTGLVVLEGPGDDGRWKLIDWHSAPIGGDFLADAHAVDPTGETVAGTRETD